MSAGAEPQFAQLLPRARTVDVPRLLGELGLDALAPEERPYTVVNFIASADGHASFKGRSGPLGDAGDRALFHGLREHVDAVLAGVGTLAAEHYGRMLASAERRERRLARGLSAEPLLCVITRSGRLPAELPALDCAEARVVVFAGREPAGLAERAAAIELHLVEDLTPALALSELRRAHGVRSLLCEGGPTLFGALLAAGLVDELFLTLAPKLVGGSEAPGVTEGPEPETLRELELRWVLERAGSLFLRYGVLARR